jgi:hypothetical protein
MGEPPILMNGGFCLFALVLQQGNHSDDNERERE